MMRTTTPSRRTRKTIVLKPLRLVVLASALVAVITTDAATQEKGQPESNPKAGVKADSIKGYLPPNWKKLGLSDVQRDKITAIAGQYSAQIDALEERIQELKAQKMRKQLEILTPDQKKALEDIYKRKAGTDK